MILICDEICSLLLFDDKQNGKMELQEMVEIQVNLLRTSSI